MPTFDNNITQQFIKDQMNKILKKKEYLEDIIEFCNNEKQKIICVEKTKLLKTFIQNNIDKCNLQTKMNIKNSNISIINYQRVKRYFIDNENKQHEGIENNIYVDVNKHKFTFVVKYVGFVDGSSEEPIKFLLNDQCVCAVNTWNTNMEYGEYAFLLDEDEYIKYDIPLTYIDFVNFAKFLINIFLSEKTYCNF